MKIYGIDNNINEAIEAVKIYGVACIEGTKTPAVMYANKVIEHSKGISDIDLSIGYQNVPNHGYLYYVYDGNRFSNAEEDLVEIIYEIDRQMCLNSKELKDFI